MDSSPVDHTSLCLRAQASPGSSSSSSSTSVWVGRELGLPVYRHRPTVRVFTVCCPQTSLLSDNCEPWTATGSKSNSNICCWKGQLMNLFVQYTKYDLHCIFPLWLIDSWSYHFPFYWTDLCEHVAKRSSFGFDSQLQLRAFLFFCKVDPLVLMCITIIFIQQLLVYVFIYSWSWYWRYRMWIITTREWSIVQYVLYESVSWHTWLLPLPRSPNASANELTPTYEAMKSWRELEWPDVRLPPTLSSLTEELDHNLQG